MRAQAAKLAGDLKLTSAYDVLTGLTRDPYPRARYFALMALGKLGNLEAVDLRTGKVRNWFPKVAPRVWSASVEGVVRGEVFVGGQFCSS